MYKSIVNELALSDTIEIKVRSSEGAEIVLQVKSEEKFSKLKEEIWRNIGTKTQLKIGDAIVDIMTEYIQSTELSYDAFGALPEAEQVCKGSISSNDTRTRKMKMILWHHNTMLSLSAL